MVQLVTHIVWQHLKAKHLLQMPQRWQGSHVDLIAAALHTPKMKEFGPKKRKRCRRKEPRNSARRISGGTAGVVKIGVALEHRKKWSRYFFWFERNIIVLAFKKERDSILLI